MNSNLRTVAGRCIGNSQCLASAALYYNMFRYVEYPARSIECNISWKKLDAVARNCIRMPSIIELPQQANSYLMLVHISNIYCWMQDSRKKHRNWLQKASTIFSAYFFVFATINFAMQKTIKISAIWHSNISSIDCWIKSKCIAWRTNICHCMTPFLFAAFASQNRW